MTFISWTGAILLAFCSVPELWRSYNSKSCSLSWGFLLMWFFGEIAVLVPVLTKQLGLFLVFNYSLNVLIIAALIYYKTKKFSAPKFEAGDKVTAYGNNGTIKKISVNGYLEVELEGSPSVHLFHKDGRFSKWQKEPVLRKK